MTMDEATIPLHGRSWAEAVAIQGGEPLAAATSGDLFVDYAEAAEEWTASGDAEVWATTRGDGLEGSDRQG
jgi:hypothetical protein